jgi:hypothetical protein
MLVLERKVKNNFTDELMQQQKICQMLTIDVVKFVFGLLKNVG